MTSGAANDIEQATRLARAMITRFGMSPSFDMVALETLNNAYLGGDATLACSADTAAKIDVEVMNIIKEAHQKAKDILLANRDKLDEIAAYLLSKETITGDEFMAILNGEVLEAGELKELAEGEPTSFVEQQPSTKETEQE